MIYTAVRIHRHGDKIIGYVLRAKKRTLRVSAQDLKKLMRAGMQVSNLTLTSDNRLVRKKPAQTKSLKQVKTKPETNTKYTLLRQSDMSITVHGRQLYRIRANANFGDVKKGDIGGYIESEDNLSMSGNCWVYNNAKVMSKARVLDNAKVQDYAVICGSAKITGNAVVKHHARVECCGQVMDSATVKGTSSVWDWGEVCDNAIVEDSALVCGWAKVKDNARIMGYATLDERSSVGGNAVIGGLTVANGHAQIYGNVQVKGANVIPGGMEEDDGVSLGRNAWVLNRFTFEKRQGLVNWVSVKCSVINWEISMLC